MVTLLIFLLVLISCSSYWRIEQVCMSDTLVHVWMCLKFTSFALYFVPIHYYILGFFFFFFVRNYNRLLLGMY
jgi:hypothetical protein